MVQPHKLGGFKVIVVCFFFLEQIVVLLSFHFLICRFHCADPQAAKSTPTSPGATMPPSSMAMKRGVEKSGHAPTKRTKASASKQKYQSPSSQ